MFTVKYQTQSAVIADRIANASAYLSALADSAEAERRATLAPPAGITLENYSRFQQPLRGRLLAMLGYPPPGTPVASNPVFTELGEDDHGIYYQMTMPLLQEGLQAQGMLIKPHKTLPNRALAVAIHGGGGTPELAAGILDCTSGGYNNMGRRLARRGHLVWMPACYETDTIYTDDQVATTPDPHRFLELKARIVGSTLSAIDAYAIMRSTEAVLNWAGLEQAIAVGLSYGGFRAMLAASLSEQFVACVSSCYVNNRRQILEANAPHGNFQDWYFNNVLRMVTDVELCRLICPRPLCIEVGVNDELFPVQGARETAAEVYDAYDTLGVTDRFEFIVFDGAHEFSGIEAFRFLERMGL